MDEQSNVVDGSTPMASLSPSDIFNYLGTAMQIATALAAAAGAFQSGQPVTVPEIRTYVSGKHIGIDITVKPL